MAKGIRKGILPPNNPIYKEGWAISTVPQKTAPHVHLAESNNATESKRKYCKRCKKKTRHIISFFSNLPFICANEHPDDQTHCAVCRKEILPKPDGILERLITQAGLPSIRKRICSNCTKKIL